MARFWRSVDCESAARKAASAARKLAQTASGEVWASARLRDAAGILAELGDAKAARDAAIAIDDPESQAKAPLRVAKAQIDAGDLAAARATACEARVAARMVPFGGAGLKRSSDRHRQGPGDRRRQCGLARSPMLWTAVTPSSVARSRRGTRRLALLLALAAVGMHLLLGSHWRGSMTRT